MPRKVRELRRLLNRAEFIWRSGKGSHQVWQHPLLPHRRIVISKADGDDAPSWLEKQVMEALRELKELKNSEESEE